MGLHFPYNCEHCGFESESPQRGFLACAKCAQICFAGDLRSPFDVLGIPVRFDLNENALEKRYFDLSRMLHPDRFGSNRGAQLIAQKYYAAVNQAYENVRTKQLRLESFLEAAALNSEDKTQKRIPMDLAEEFFELQESAFENPVEARVHAQMFRKKLESLIFEIDQTVFKLAETINWASVIDHKSAKDDSNLHKLLQLRGERAYIASLIENTKKLIPGSEQRSGA